MAVFTYTIGSVGKDFASVNLFEAGIPADTTDTYRGRCEIDEIVASFLFANVSNIHNSPHGVYADESIRHGFRPGVGPRMLNGVYTCNDWQMEYMGWEISFSGYFCSIDNNADGMKWLNCYFWQTGDSAQKTIGFNKAGTVRDTIFEGCCFHTDSTTQVWLVNAAATSGTGKFINCSFLQTDTTITGPRTMISSGAALNVFHFINCKVLGPAIDGINTKTFSGSNYNAASNNNVIGDTLFTIGTVYTNESAADHFANITAGSSTDMHVNPSLDLSGFIGGNEVAGNPDAEGTIRVEDFVDIGAHQASVAAVGGPPVPGPGDFFSSFDSFGKMGMP